MSGHREIERARNDWLNGGSALPLSRLLAEQGERIEAAAVARLALARDDCVDRTALEALLGGLSAPPPSWGDSLAELAAAPTLQGWRDLMRFVPPEHFYLRVRDAIAQLSKLGVDPSLLFLFATEHGMTPDAIELVERGSVPPAAILRRAEESHAAKTTYFGLAAAAASLAGDVLGTVRWLREALAHENGWCSAHPHIVFVRKHASPEQVEMLDRAGIP